jgi:deoxyribonuclease V
MIAALDVHYDGASRRGTGAALVFDNWDDALPAAEYTAVVENVQPYVPGAFFRRELPCLLAVLAKILEPIDVLVIDGYVQLGDQPGMGQILWEHLLGKTPVVGVAKSRFHNAEAIDVVRGESEAPLFVTAIGVDPAKAAGRIRSMHGPHRIPTLLQRVDQLSRGR